MNENNNKRNFELLAFAGKLGAQFDRQASSALKRADMAGETCVAYEVSDRFDVAFAPVYAAKHVRATFAAERANGIADTHRANVEAKVFNKTACVPQDVKKKLHEARIEAMALRGEDRKLALLNVAKLARAALKAAVTEAAEAASAQ